MNDEERADVLAEVCALASLWRRERDEASGWLGHDPERLLGLARRLGAPDYRVQQALARMGLAGSLSRGEAEALEGSDAARLVHDAGCRYVTAESRAYDVDQCDRCRGEAWARRPDAARLEAEAAHRRGEHFTNGCPAVCPFEVGVR